MRSIAFAVAAALVLAVGSSALAASGGWTPTKTQGLSLKGTSLGALSPSTPLHVSVALRMRNANGLQSAIRSGVQLTPEQFVQQYAPTLSAAQAVEQYLTTQGLTNVAITTNRLFVTGDATAAQAEAAFNTHLVSYQVNGATMFANSTAAEVPASLGGAVLSVLGLNNAATMSGNVQKRMAATLPNWLQALVAQVQATVGTTTTTVTKTVGGLLGGTVQKTLTSTTQQATSTVTNVLNAVLGDIPSYLVSYTPQGFWKAYDVGKTPGGSRTSVAIFGAGDMSGVVQDLRTEERADKLPQVPVTLVYTGLRSPAEASDEWDMDTQFSTGMADGVARLYVYSATTLTDSDLALAFNSFASQDKAQAGSASFGECEYQAYLDGSMVAWDQIFAEAAAQGQTVFASSGDTGGFCPVAPNNGVPAGIPDVNYPASSPYVVSAGGTTLLTNTDGSYNDEAAWLAGGGGPSIFEIQPFWQQGVAPPTGTACVDAAACAGKTLPDIAMDADPNSGANVYVSGSPEAVGGTSLSSPLSLGVWARLESGHANKLGFAALPLYREYQSTGFHDVILGDTGPYPATPGYDLATGMGSFDVAAMNARIASAMTPAAAAKVPSPACTVFTDQSGDAQPEGSTGNVSSLDILAGGFSTSGSTLTGTILVKSLDDGPGGTTAIAGDGDAWYELWTAGGATRFVGAEMPGTTEDTSNPGVPVDFFYGTVETSATGGTLYNQDGSATGSLDTAHGLVKISVPLATVGLHARQSLTATGAKTFESVGTPAGGLLETADTAGPGKTYVTGRHC
ncbi:MAG: S53 family peptidase [Gaiellaceae bacterium]